MPAEIQRLVDRFLKSPERIEAAPQSTAASTITQRFKFVSPDPKQKRAALRDWIREESVKNAIIFCNRKRDVDILFKSLIRHGLNAGCLHGDMDQRQRTATLDAFRAGTLTFLAASDVAARGLDIPEVSHVFNYDVPIAAEDYVHRIGRTGRAGRSGFSATIVTDDDMRTLRDIEKMLKAPVEWVGDPPPEDAGTKTGKRRRMSEAGSGRDERGGDRRDGRRSPSGRSEGRRPRRPEGERPAPVAELPADPPAIAAAEITPDPAVQDQPVVVSWPASEAAPPREPREGSRSRQRGERSSRRRDAAPDGERAPRRSEERRDAPSGERAPRRRERSAETGPHEERRPRQPKPQRDGQPERERTVGMGDHVPAFMRRPPRGGSSEQEG